VKKYQRKRKMAKWHQSAAMPWRGGLAAMAWRGAISVTSGNGKNHQQRFCLTIRRQQHHRCGKRVAVVASGGYSEKRRKRLAMAFSGNLAAADENEMAASKPWRKRPGVAAN
jgi:hypothetical protein